MVVADGHGPQGDPQGRADHHADHALLIRDEVQGPVLLDLNQAGEPRCFLRGDPNPTPIAKIARVEQASADDDPIRRLRELFGKAA